MDELLRLSQLIPDWTWSRAAIIAREWRQLDPVRRYAEAIGIPVESAGETMPPVWRMREMQAFITALRREPARLFDVPALIDTANALPQNRWTDLIAEGIAALNQELANKAAAMPVPDLIEWFAEWARDTRGAQRGLLLLSAHRAKGLEFDDVVILNGGWDRTSRGEDADAPRRLFYVSMTRARRSLAVMTEGRHPFPPGDGAEVLLRPVAPRPEALARCGLRYVTADMKQVDLSYPGRLRAGDTALQAIASASIGDPVTLAQENGTWIVRNASGAILTRTSRAFAPPPDAAYLRGEVAAILRWRKADSAEEYHAGLKRDEWEVVLPELVFG